jgi:hypothetical protein
MSTYRQYHEALMHMIDEVALESDPADRLRWTRDLLLDAQAALIRQRDAAAYDLRLRMTSDNAERASGISKDRIADWMHAHRDRTGAPAVPRFRQDLSGAKDLSVGDASPRHPTLR